MTCIGDPEPDTTSSDVPPIIGVRMLVLFKWSSRSTGTSATAVATVGSDGDILAAMEGRIQWVRLEWAAAYEMAIRDAELKPEEPGFLCPPDDAEIDWFLPQESTAKRIGVHTPSGSYYTVRGG